MTDDELIPHEYLSTGCLHGQHEYCRNMVGYQGEKRPGRCKFCEATCRCACHAEASRTGVADPVTTSIHL